MYKLLPPLLPFHIRYINAAIDLPLSASINYFYCSVQFAAIAHTQYTYIYTDSLQRSFIAQDCGCCRRETLRADCISVCIGSLRIYIYIYVYVCVSAGAERFIRKAESGGCGPEVWHGFQSDAILLSSGDFCAVSFAVDACYNFASFVPMRLLAAFVFAYINNVTRFEVSQLCAIAMKSRCATVFFLSQ